MTALVVFHGDGLHWIARWLKPGFRHVFVCVESDRGWARDDWRAGSPKIDVLGNYSPEALAEFYCKQCFAVVETNLPPARATAWAWPFAMNSCVGRVKAILGIRHPFVLTPWQLYRFLERRHG